MGTVLITGTNRGIGLEFCKHLISKENYVIAACRKASAELNDLQSDKLEVHEGLDVTDSNSIDNLVKRVGDRKLDILINNAGILEPNNLENLDIESIRRQFEVNSLGPLRVSRAFLESMNRPGKIIIITSRMGSIADNGSGGYYGYRMSKSAVNMAGVSLAHDLKGRKIAVGILHPGYVRTDMTGNQGMIDPDESVRGLLERIENLNLENSGSFWHSNGEGLPW